MSAQRASQACASLRSLQEIGLTDLNCRSSRDEARISAIDGQPITDTLPTQMPIADVERGLELAVLQHAISALDRGQPILAAAILRERLHVLGGGDEIGSKDV